MRSKVCIPIEEYGQRISRAAKLVAEKGYDVLIANSNEADFANVRYLSGFWPLFEIAGAAVAADGKAALMVGPESQEFASSWSPVKNVHQMIEYRESADPQFPGGNFSKFSDVFDSLGIRIDKQRLDSTHIFSDMASLLSSCLEDNLLCIMK